VLATTVDALNVHAEFNHDLVVTVVCILIFGAYLHCYIRNLDHLEIVLHLFLQNLCVNTLPPLELKD